MTHHLSRMRIVTLAVMCMLGAIALSCDDTTTNSPLPDPILFDASFFETTSRVETDSIVDIYGLEVARVRATLGGRRRYVLSGDRIAVPNYTVAYDICSAMVRDHPEHVISTELVQYTYAYE
jgi:hypothetical protein